MSAKIIDGKAISQEIIAEVKKAVEHRLQQGKRPPGLAVILVGEDPASQVYVGKKTATCEQIGFHAQKIVLPTDTTQEQLQQKITELNEDPAIDGILLQLPLPAHLDSNPLLEHIAADKDVDGFHPYNMGRLAQKQPTLRPCTPYGVITLLKKCGIEIMGTNSVVVGASNIVGRPMALELLLERSTVQVCHSKTKNLAELVGQADIVVAAVGIPEFVKGEWIKSGAVVIDVGINRLDTGKLVGDVEYDKAAEKAAWITPVPGGVGPMTVATLMQNTLYAAENLHD